MDIIIYGIINSVTLALMALGFTLVYGVSRLPNFAHGALYVLTGFLAWFFINQFTVNYFLAGLGALLITGVVGALMYHLILVRVRGMAISEIIASYAIGLAILEGLRYGGLKGGTYVLRPFVDGSTSILGVPVDYQRILVVVLGALLVGMLWFFVNKTRLGLALKGMAQDERAALTLGIDSDRMAVVSMALGSVFAGLAALVLMPLGNIAVEAGYHVLIMAVAVCIVGGLGSWTGAVFAAFIIGFAQILTDVILGAHFQVVVALIAIIITLILRPSGLFGRQKELEERV
ncbi:branched-chain amino acid ABC transporter permease [Dethiosulfatarculus sandiegensis]|uniref:Branched-chain amino acid ABC transporter permease n=1 Tax=Dethiosulfatarculus sandiegensis TaxID=1429043 RepID=A0A0D2GFL7_9BACT|nr:branched-chain amino acid ABC transporter permease [Dethiosulfatarculus sandiegensis]KIX13732.1 branched-chain amino acid ABC transporter permease [Dethiosulfatarculus sandiegensis]